MGHLGFMSFRFYLPLYFCFVFVLGYNPSTTKGEDKPHKHVKRDEVVLFDNVKEYGQKPGK